MDGIDNLCRKITTSLGKFTYFNLREIHLDGHDIEEFPFSIRILLENIVRNFDNGNFNKTHLDNILK